jgi:hypothetical protein
MKRLPAVGRPAYREQVYGHGEYNEQEANKTFRKEGKGKRA